MDNTRRFKCMNSNCRKEFRLFNGEQIVCPFCKRVDQARELNANFSIRGRG